MGLQVVSLMAFMLALVFIFEIINREVDSITKPHEGIVGVRDVESGPRPGETSDQHTSEEHQQGHNVALPSEATENGQPLNEVYAEVTGSFCYICWHAVWPRAYATIRDVTAHEPIHCTYVKFIFWAREGFALA